MYYDAVVQAFAKSHLDGKWWENLWDAFEAAHEDGSFDCLNDSGAPRGTEVTGPDVTAFIDSFSDGFVTRIEVFDKSADAMDFVIALYNALIAKNSIKEEDIDPVMIAKIDQRKA